MKRIIALNCAVHTGRYSLDAANGNSETDRLQALRQVEKLQQGRIEIRNKLKKEKNLGTQARLNTQVKQITDRIEAIKKEI